MTTTTDIANFALAALGAGQINDISDPGDAAVLCSNLVGDAIQAVTAEGQWQSLIKRTQINSIGSGLDAWLCTFELPQDLVVLISCMVIINENIPNVAQQTGLLFTDSPPYFLGDETEFYLEGGLLYANSTPLTLKYVALPVNYGALPTMLGQAIAYRLATLVGPGLNVDINRLAWVEQKYKDALGLAGRFEKRDRQYMFPKRTWGDPT